MTYAGRIALRHTPDPAQTQVVLGAILGGGRLVAEADGMRLVVALSERHAWLAEWTYQRIAPLAPMPRRGRGRVLLRSEAHALFADLAALERPRRLLSLVGREGLWVWSMYARVSGCERLVREASCGCAPATPPPLRTLLRAS